MFGKIKQDRARFLGKIEQDLPRFTKIDQDNDFAGLSKIEQDQGLERQSKSTCILHAF